MTREYPTSLVSPLHLSLCYRINPHTNLLVKLHINDMWIGLNRWHIASPLVTSVFSEIAFKNKNCRKGYFIQMIDMINCIFCTFDCLHSLKIRTIQKKLILTTIRKHLKHWCFHYWHKSTNDQSLLIKVNHFLFLTSKSKVDFQSYKTPKVDIRKTAIQSYWCHKLEDPAISAEITCFLI